MKIFISWSGDRSKIVAEALKQFLQDVIQESEPFLSSRDIEKGTRPSEVITKNLAEESLGILCLTSSNLKSEWIHFEAGAISKAGEDVRVWTLLIGVGPTDVEKPLSDFQHTNANSKADVIELIKSVNKKGSAALDEPRLLRAFNSFWPDFETSVKKAIVGDAMDSVPKQIRKERDLIEETLESVRQIERTQEILLDALRDVYRETRQPKTAMQTSEPSASRSKRQLIREVWLEVARREWSTEDIAISFVQGFQEQVGPALYRLEMERPTEFFVQFTEPISRGILDNFLSQQPFNITITSWK